MLPLSLLFLMGVSFASMGGGLELTEAEDEALEADGLEDEAVGDVNLSIDGTVGDETLDDSVAGVSLTGDSCDPLLFCVGDDDLLFGSEGDDTLSGGLGNDGLFGREGGDSVSGGVGADSLYGEEGDDMLFGGDGSDYVRGEQGDDVLYGEHGDDTLLGGNDDDTLYGGDGNDSLSREGGSDALFGGGGNDLLRSYSGQEGNLYYPYGEQGGDTLSGGEGDDIFQFDIASGLDVNSTIVDFDPSEDVILINVGSSTGTLNTYELDVTVEDWPDGTGADISAEGNVLARISGAQGLDPTSIIAFASVF